MKLPLSLLLALALTACQTQPVTSVIGVAEAVIETEEPKEDETEEPKEDLTPDVSIDINEIEYECNEKEKDENCTYPLPDYCTDPVMGCSRAPNLHKETTV